MNLVNINSSFVRTELTHAEFEFLKGLVEHAAEIDHDAAFAFPSLLAGFRDIAGQIQFATEEGHFINGSENWPN